VHAVPATSRQRSPRRCRGRAAPAERYFLRYPHELSGGQRQRVVIAGALVSSRGAVADEPVSSLDASVRGEILALLLRLRESWALGARRHHDLGLAWNIADRIAVMYLGRIVESGRPSRCSTTRSTRTPGAAVGRAGDDQLEPVVLAGEPPDPTGSRRLPLPPALPALASGAAEAAGSRTTAVGPPFRCCPRQRTCRRLLPLRPPTGSY
jgi:peptide/nickel transport system ATP-binding protein